MAASSNTLLAPTKQHSLWIFSMLWLLTFIIYLPAAKAGWVIDASGWLYNIRHLSFGDYINTRQSHIPSLYQFTQFITYIFYKLFNANPYAWHTLMVTLHAINAYLLYNICRNLFNDSGIAKANAISLTGVVLYTICPHISEVIVWEASYHYLQGFLFILLILRLVQQFIHQPKKQYALIAISVFLCSAFSLEVFYLTPWFVLTLGLYYRFVLGTNRKVLRQLLFYFFIPMLAIFFVQVIAVKVMYGTHLAHVPDSAAMPWAGYFCKPAKYIFHILFFGRYFDFAIRSKTYKVLESTGGLVAFYGVFLLFWGYVAFRFKSITARNKAALLLLVWMILSIVILLPLAFPDMLLMFYDRYTYFFEAFTYMLIALLAGGISNKYIGYTLLGIYGIINLYFTFKVNRYWKHSTYIDNRLMKELPNPGTKTVILLNIPENMNGIAMIGAQPGGQYKAMREMFVDSSIKNTIRDAASYNMLTPEDGAHVTVKNDSTIVVTLNQWGSWWWYEGHGCSSYETQDYKLNLTDPGHEYILTLKRPTDNFLLLYNVGPIWKIVDMGKKGTEQY